MKFKEGLEIELKEIYTTDLKKEVIAFANSNDGNIYIGISDNGDIVGIEDLDNVMQQVGNSLRNAIKPDITPFIKIQNEEIKNKDIIKIEVQRGCSRPYYIADKGLKPSGVYVRQGSSSVPASYEMIRQMIKETDGDSYEKARSLIQNLTFEYANLLMIKLGIDFKESQKKTLGIIGEDSLYTNLGLLISDQCLHSIKIAVFQGVEKTIFKDRKEFSGSILKQLSDAFDYIDLSNKTSATFKGLVRTDKRDYPIDAIREALLNTIVHREYSFSSSTLINIYYDRIEFISLGGLVSGLSLEAVMLGISQSRNEKIANLFYRIHFIESYGTGIKKIMSSYGNENVKPTITAVEGAFQVILPNTNINNNSIDEIIQNNSGDNQNIIPLKTQENNVLELINKKGIITRKEIEIILNIKQTRAGQILKELANKNIIFAIGTGKNRKYSK